MNLGMNGGREEEKQETKAVTSLFLREQEDMTPIDSHGIKLR